MNWFCLVFHYVQQFYFERFLNETEVSLFKVMISPVSDSKVRAFGPGLESGVANLPSIFLIETNGGRCEQIGWFTDKFFVSVKCPLRLFPTNAVSIVWLES